jgi:drug/metabolite transporter (DMT)-like permease
MKLNFWQILGIVLVVIGVVMLVRRPTGRNDTVTPDNSNPPAATSPTTAPGMGGPATVPAAAE